MMATGHTKGKNLFAFMAEKWVFRFFFQKVWALKASKI